MEIDALGVPGGPSEAQRDPGRSQDAHRSSNIRLYAKKDRPNGKTFILMTDLKARINFLESEIALMAKP